MDTSRDAAPVAAADVAATDAVEEPLDDAAVEEEEHVVVVLHGVRDV